METVTPILKPDRARMLEHLTMLFGRAMDGKIEITAIKATGERIAPRFRYFQVDELEEAAEWAGQVNSEHMWNVYVGAALRHPDTFPGQVANDSDFYRTYAVWADADNEAQLSSARRVYSDLNLAPATVVVTGRTPERRAQMWWPLETPITDIETLRATLRALAVGLGTDPAVTSGKQLMRLGGSLAWPKAGKTGRILEATEITHPRAALREVTLEHIQRAFPTQAVARTSEVASLKNLVSPEHASQRERFAMTMEDGGWHQGALAFTASLIHQGVPPEAVLSMAPAFQRDGYTLAETEDQLRVMIEGAVAKYAPKPEPVTTPPEEGAPLPILDPWERYIVPTFPMDTLPAFLRRYVEQQALSIGACRSGIAMAALTAASAAISHDYRLKMLQTGDWHVRPRLWTVLVGDPSDKKSPIVNAVTAPLHERDIEASSEYAKAYARWQEAVEEKAAKRKDEPARPPRHVVQDVTAEKLSEILSRSDRGALIQRDELAGWIGSMEQYKSGRGAGSADRAHWIKAYDGGRYTVDRVKGEIVLTNFSVSFLGAVQPDRLAELGNLTSDGLLQRFLPVMLGKPSLPEEVETDATAEEYARVLSYLASSRSCRILNSRDATDVVKGFQAFIHEQEQAGIHSKGMTGFLGKLPGVLGSLMLVLHMLEDPEAARETPVDGRTARTAERIIMEFVIPHALEFYRAADDKTDGEVVRAIASYLLTSDLARFRASDFTTNVRQLRGMSLWDLQRRLSLLVAGGWLRPEDHTPNCRAWVLEDGVREAFGARRQAEAARKVALREQITRLGMGEK